VAGVLLDYECLRDHRVRPLALLNDSKQVDAATRDELYRAVLACAERVSVTSSRRGDRPRRAAPSNLRGLREALWACQPADVCLVDGFRLGPPPRRTARSSTATRRARDRARVDRREGDARPLHAHRRRDLPGVRLLVARRLHHARAQRDRARDGPCEIHRRSFQALCYHGREPTPSSRAQPRNERERRAARWYRLRGYRILDTNRWLAAASSTSSSAAGGTLVFAR
jgi:hypothetical protein